jgi:hypothetical protein
MNLYPSLKTGAAAQYPFRTRQVFRTQTLTFLDGTEQRYSQCSRGLKAWILNYSQLEEAEMQILRDFVSQHTMTNTPFVFVDPQTSIVYQKCRLAQCQLTERWVAEESGTATVGIEEVME